MADDLPASRPPSALDDLARLGVWLAASESDENTPQARGATAALRLYYARELGLTPMAAAELSVIGGKLVVSAALQRALAKRAGFHVKRITEPDNINECRARIIDIRTGEILGDATFTIEDARRAGLIRDRSAWKTHPARMLWARATTNVIKDYAPEVTMGMILDDEAAEIQQHDEPDTDLPWTAAAIDADAEDDEADDLEEPDPNQLEIGAEPDPDDPPTDEDGNPIDF